MNMDEKHILSILIVVFCIYEPTSSTTSDTLPGPAYETYNVTKFMDTAEKIWTLNSTKNSSVWCRNDEVAIINGSKIYFNRSFMNRKGSWQIQAYEGEILDFSRPKDLHDKKYEILFRYFMPYAMLVGPKGTEPSTLEELEYASDDYDCGVFRVIYNVDPKDILYSKWYDLRFRGSSVSKVTSKCTQYFQERMKEEPMFDIYNDTCQSL
uniref:Putative group i salivary lipocalin n=1 Tax=Rhipicephalus pulchellus TaxID=72859 RepID=L7LQR7_RHIPC